MGWGESKESVHHACDRRIVRLERQVVTLTEALRVAERRLAEDAINAADWAPEAERQFMDDLRTVRAALATQEAPDA